MSEGAPTPNQQAAGAAQPANGGPGGPRPAASGGGAAGWVTDGVTGATPPGGTAPVNATATAAASPAPARVRTTVGAGAQGGGTAAAVAGAGSAVGTAPAPRRGPRKARLTIARIDPVSALKFSFLMSFAVGIINLVMTAVFWYMLNGMGLFVTISDKIAEIAGPEVSIDILQYVEFGRVMSLATLISLADVVLLTIIGVLFALLYNLIAVLVGGITVSLSDE